MKNFALYFITLLVAFGCNAQTNKSIEYQKGFAKAYGYVKYFHPSDEAATIDWDKFAIYGSSQVEVCTSDEEFLKTLKTIFEPIAPSIKFHIDQEDLAFDFQKITPKDLKNYDLTYWQHEGVSIGMNNSGQPYTSTRINREYEIDISSSFGNIVTSVKATAYKGKKIKYSGWVKLEKGSEGNGRLWFRVDTSDGDTGFFDNMGNAPITENEWQYYEIKGTIDSSASNLVFGCFLTGKGKLLLDEIKLTYLEGEDWIDIPLKNNGFEGKNLTDEGQWRHSGTGYIFELTGQDKFEGNKAATIQYKGELEKGKGDAIFKRHSKFGELINKKITSNIICQIPLALYCTDDTTYPTSNKDDLELLKKAIKKSSIESTELALRLGNIINVYNVFQHFYPYFDVVTVDWDKELERALKSSYTDKTEKDHLATLQKLTASLKDGHIRVSSSKMDRFVPPIAWEWVENKLIITSVYDSNIGLKIGDEVTQIDGLSATIFFKEVNAKISAGTEGWLKYRARSESLMGPKDSKISLRVKNQNIELLRNMDAYQRRKANSDQKTAYREINKDVFYLNLDIVAMDTINKLLPKLENYKSIICDLRGYPKGNHDFISHLLKRKDTTKGWMQVPQIIYPDQENIVGWEKFEWKLGTSKPYLGDKQIIFITDGSAISYAESFMGYIEGYNLGTIIGQPTAGTNGNVNPFKLPGGYRLSWTGMKVTKHNGSQNHAVGVTPDIYISKTVDGIKTGSDEFLEKAIELTETTLIETKTQIKD